jgi:hypothetical protein
MGEIFYCDGRSGEITKSGVLFILYMRVRRIQPPHALSLPANTCLNLKWKGINFLSAAIQL